MLKASNINLEGLDATIVGVSNNVGTANGIGIINWKNALLLHVIVKQKI